MRQYQNTPEISELHHTTPNAIIDISTGERDSSVELYNNTTIESVYPFNRKLKMAVAAAEPLFNRNVSIGNYQQAGGAASVVSSGARTVFPKLEMKERPFFKPISQMTLMEQVMAIVAVFSIFLSLVGMLAEWSTYAIVGSILQIIMGTYAYYQQTQITTMTIMKEKSNALEKDVVRLQGENTRMSYDVDELEGRVEDLLDVEDALEVIASSETQCVDALEKDSGVNHEIVGQIQQSTQASVIETLISSIYCRQGTDDKISEEEVAAIIEKLDDIVGLTVYEDRLSDTVAGNTIDSIIDALQNLLDGDIPAKKQIFRVY